MSHAPILPRLVTNYSTISSSDSDSSDSGPDSSRKRYVSRSQRKSSQKTNGTENEPLRRNSINEDGADLLSPQTPPKSEGQIVTWKSLPRKGQLALLTVARLSEPLVQSSLRSYLFYQLRSFDKSLPDSTIASQAGIIQGAFAAAQLCTAMLWGRMSDRQGRKSVILLGLAGSTFSCIAFGFSTSFTQALIFRSLGGALNGNVGVMRTMVSEIIREKKFQSRAFLILPMTANIGVIIGPMLGGLTSDPVAAYPSLFGGIQWLEKFPYSPPNIMSAIILTFALFSVWLGLEETHEAFMHRSDIGLKISQKITSLYRKLRGRKAQEHSYSVLNSDVPTTPIVEMSPAAQNTAKCVRPHYPNTLPFRRIFTYNVICTLVSHSLLALSLGTFQSVFYTFLSTPVYDPAHPLPNYTPHLPFRFTGGTGLSAREIGFYMSSLGFLGIAMQLFIYPAVNTRLGTVRSWRIILYCFPIAYTLTPYLAVLPSTSAPPLGKTGILFWMALVLLIFLFVVGRTFAAPAAQILVNNCCPHPTVLGTVHGIGTSVSAAARTIGPAVGGWIYGVGLEKGAIGSTFWLLAALGCVSCFASTFVKDGNGHEIYLEGDLEAEAEADEANRGLTC